MNETNHIANTRALPAKSIPPLESGDHLTREEFERRYHAMPHIKKAELIEGVVYMPSPVRASKHARPQGGIVAWLYVYQAATPGTMSYVNPTVRLNTANVPQPDGVLLILPECGGQSTFSDDDYIQSAPELLAEIAASTASIDIGKKLEIYRRSGVREYVVYRVLDGEFDWFVLRDDEYERQSPDENGLLKSIIFPGLWLDVNALINDDFPRMLAVLQQGLASPEHAEFVTKLQDAVGEKDD